MHRPPLCELDGPGGGEMRLRPHTNCLPHDQRVQVQKIVGLHEFLHGIYPISTVTAVIPSLKYITTPV